MGVRSHTCLKAGVFLWLIALSIFLTDGTCVVDVAIIHSKIGLSMVDVVMYFLEIGLSAVDGVIGLCQGMEIK